MADTIPALSMPYGRPSYWDELKQKKTQGYTVSDKQATALAYGERYGELANEMNRQKINRDLALQEYRDTNAVAYKNKMLDLNKDTADKTFYGQLGGLGIAALMNSDKLIKGGTALWNLGEKGYDLYNYYTGPDITSGSGTYGIEDPWGGQIDQIPAVDFDPYSFDYGGMDPYDYANFADIGNSATDAYSFAYDGLDPFDYANLSGETAASTASDYSYPYYTIAKYGTYALNELGKETDFQPLLNITQPAWGVFEGISKGLQEMTSPIWSWMDF